MSWQLGLLRRGKTVRDVHMDQTKQPLFCSVLLNTCTMQLCRPARCVYAYPWDPQPQFNAHKYWLCPIIGIIIMSEVKSQTMLISLGADRNKWYILIWIEAASSWHDNGCHRMDHQLDYAESCIHEVKDVPLVIKEIKNKTATIWIKCQVLNWWRNRCNWELPAMALERFTSFLVKKCWMQIDSS